MDTVKEFRSMFLQRYLEKNKIGRRSISRSKTKPKPIASSMNSASMSMPRNSDCRNYKLSKSFDGKILAAKSNNEEELDDDDDDINKYFDFNRKQADANNRVYQRFSLPNAADDFETYDEMMARESSQHMQSPSLSFLNSQETNPFQQLVNSYTDLGGSETNSTTYSLNLNNTEDSFVTNLNCLDFNMVKSNDFYYQGKNIKMNQF